MIAVKACTRLSLHAIIITARAISISTTTHKGNCWCLGWMSSGIPRRVGWAACRLLCRSIGGVAGRVHSRLLSGGASAANPHTVKRISVCLTASRNVEDILTV